MSATYVVEKGDCLYSIDRENWQRIYECNRDVIGSDPRLIHTGQRLKLPPCEPVLLPDQCASAADSCELPPDYYSSPDENNAQICELTVWNSADVQRMFSSKWYLEALAKMAADQLHRVEVGRLLKLAEEYSYVGISAIDKLVARAKNGELTIEDLKKAAGHDNSHVRAIAAKNELTPTDVLFALANEDSFVGISAIANLEARTNR